MLALMSWFSLHALVSLYGAELNAALIRRRGKQELEQQQFDLSDGFASGHDRSHLAQ
jgi:uncharacterized BrkB/YihY/UPF0761 family membrane protein